MTDTNKQSKREGMQRLKQGRTSRKTEKKQEARYQKKNRIMKCEEETLDGKTDPKMGLLIPVESLFFDPNALSRQCLLHAVHWLQQVLCPTLRMWPTAARQGPLLCCQFNRLLLGPKWLITST